MKYTQRHLVNRGYGTAMRGTYMVQQEELVLQEVLAQLGLKAIQD